ncbi:MAG: helix-hairpin-helix domain-containing protein [Deltaproteobacteria bacterium]|nr:helix-hairpin-helix domain-containing protein [Deltaproteobacteria bacterium]
MADTAHPATPEQRRRSLTLATLCVSLTVAGVVARAAGGGAPPEACARPGLRGGVLVCDGTGAPPGARAWLVGARLDINTASARELEAIPGVGPALTRSIIESRETRGGFRDWQELDEVPGIGPKTLAKLEAYLRVAPPD